LNALEQQIRDCRTNCIKIRVECDKQEKVISELTEKKKELEDDRRFLDFEIRDCRQQNQSLKLAISKTHNKCDDLNTTKGEILGKFASISEA
jgi:phage shock protein A